MCLLFRFTFFAICSVILSSLGVDFMTSLTAVTSCVSNINPGFGMLGSTEQLCRYPDLGQVAPYLVHAPGRLEIYTVIILLAPEFLRK